MIQTYTKEFMAIGKYLRQRGECRDGFILVSKSTLKELLDKNPYDTAAHKLQIWKGLGWIKTNGEHIDYPIRVKGKLIRMIHIRMSALDTLETLEQPQKPQK